MAFMKLVIHLVLLSQLCCLLADSKEVRSSNSNSLSSARKRKECRKLSFIPVLPSVSFCNQSADLLLSCDVDAQNRYPGMRCKYQIEWYLNGTWIQFYKNGTTSHSRFLRRTHRGTKLVITRVLPSLGGNFTCRLAQDELYPARPDCPDRRQLDCYSAQSLLTQQLIVDTTGWCPHPSVRSRLPFYPPDEPHLLQSGRLYLTRQNEAPQNLLVYRNDPQDLPFDCRFLLAHPRGEQPAPGDIGIRWFRSPDRDYHNLERPFRPVVKTSRPGYAIEPLRLVPCVLKDFGLAYLGQEWEESNLTVSCYHAQLATLQANDYSHGIYKCSASYRNSSLDMFFRLGFAADLSDMIHGSAPDVPPQLEFNKNTSACLGGRVELDCLVKPATVHLMIMRLKNPKFDDFGSIVQYDSFEMLALHKYKRNFSELSEAKSSALVTVGVNDLRMKLVIDSASVKDDGYYACSAQDSTTLRTELVYSRLEILSDCVVGEAASRLHELAYAARVQIIGYGAAAGLVVFVTVAILIFIYFYAKRRSEPIKKRLRVVCADNSELYLTGRQRGDTASTSCESSSDAASGCVTTAVADSSVSRLPSVPEVVVERIRSSRSRLGFGSRRNNGDADDDEAGERINREVRYIIPSCPVLEVDRKRVQLFRLLGEGAFGSVHSGQLVIGNQPRDVAVKMLKRNYTEEELIALYKEMEIMKLMSRNPHPNIIKLVGISTRNGPFLLLVELAQHGNLRDFLKERCLADRVQVEYHNLHPGTKRMQYIPCVSSRLLLQFAADVANALDFMASIKIVHRDIAARNILVANSDLNDGNLVAKVADFGLTRNVQEKDYYRVINEGKLPVKWLAPECLRSRVFSTKSDVWAYGILLYEIYSFGGLPYAGVPPGKILEHLESGCLNSRPKHASPPVYDLMLRCWAWDPSKRPSFKEILQQLADIQLRGEFLAEEEEEKADQPAEHLLSAG